MNNSGYIEGKQETEFMEMDGKLGNGKRVKDKYCEKC